MYGILARPCKQYCSNHVLNVCALYKGGLYLIVGGFGGVDVL